MQRRFPKNALIAALLAVGAITAGCSSTTAGHPTAAGAQPPASSHGPQLGDSTGSSAPATPEATPSPSPKPKPAPPKPTIRGWQAIGDHVRNIAYDVPAGWHALDPTAPLSVGTDRRLRMFAGSLYRQGFCPAQGGSARATAGIASAFQGTMTQVAHTLARFFAREVYEQGATHARLSISKPTPVKITGAHAVEAQAVVTKDKSGRCGAPKAVVDVVVVDGGGSNGIFVLMADQGVASAISAHTISQIVGSVRRLPA